MLLNVRYLKSYQIFALAVTVSENIEFLIFNLEKVVQGHEDKNGTYVVGSQMSECVFAEFFFHNFSRLAKYENIRISHSLNI